ncbi:transmembrane protein 26 [Aedes albopictus]|uniref:Transmembrane protein 26 n=1 Tax=Aedes albopictus TaxID=7160 RepID=A0ABM1Y2E3_AEDAL
MAKLLATIKAIITRIIFSAHGFIAIWQVTQNKKDPLYWCLCVPIGVLFVEGIFTLAIKKNQEWRWFCPSVFIYLSTIVPAIWLLELDKLEKRTLFQDQMLNETINFAATVGKDLKDLNKMLGVKIQLPEIQLNADTWVTLIEQFLMLVLIIGRWMLPKGDLTRDQLSQLLLVYIGTAADIIEFFDSFKDSKIANEPVLVLLTLSIWSWSLLQFTIVLSATRARKPRGGGSAAAQRDEDTHCCNMSCCNIDVWGIALNILLQDAPFLTFRLLIIIHYKIITYMNIFFTCKNTLVILLQLYRLYVVHSENRKTASKKKKQQLQGKKQSSGGGPGRHTKHHKKTSRRKVTDYSDDEIHEMRKLKQRKAASLSAKTRKDTGYSTASSQTTAEQKHLRKKAAGKRSVEEVDDEVALEMGTARRGGGKKGSYQRKLMTSSQEREVDGDGLEELENERKRSRNRKDGGRSGDRKKQHSSGHRNRHHGKKLSEDNVYDSKENIRDHDDDDDDDADNGIVDKAGGRHHHHGGGSDENDTSEFEIIHEKSRGDKTKRTKRHRRGSASSAGSTSGSYE